MRTRSIPFLAAAAAVAAIAALAALAPGCGSLDPIGPPAVVTGDADFSSYVAIGTSISMGLQSAGVVEDLQQNSFPALLARAAGANGRNFTQPLVTTPGIPPVLTMTGITATGQPVLMPRPGTPPSGPSTPRPPDGYDNLGISGAVLSHALTKTSGDDPLNYFDLVLQGQGTMLRQCLAQSPTFVTVELGVNDVVIALLRGNDTDLISSGQFQAEYVQIMDSLAAGAPNAKLALMTMPRVTNIPFATAIPLDVTGPFGPGGAVVTIRLRDSAGPLPNGSRILLTAASLVGAGYGFPSPAPPLPDSMVITVSEKANLDAAVVAYNAVIAQQAQARGAALADGYGLFERITTDGAVIAGTRYTPAYVSGGLFSLDGLHPSSLGHGLLANEFIRAINARFGASIPPVDLAVLQVTGAVPIVEPHAPGAVHDAWRAVDPAMLAAMRRALLAE